MYGRTPLLLVALPLAVLALAGCGGDASHALPTTNNGRPASVGAVSPAGAKVGPRSQPQGGGGYGGY